MTTHPSSPTDSINRKVMWVQVWGLAAMQGAISLMWVIYNLYLVDLLTRFGLPAPLATGLLIIENVLAMVMEPLMGSLSDRFQQRLGTQFPLISAGVILAAALFVGIPAIAVFRARATLQWIFLLMLVGWALSMTVFRSPALSLLGRYAFKTRLPEAASILTLVGGLAGAMGPLANEAILRVGPAFAFAAGSGVLLLATLALRLTAPMARKATEDEADASSGPVSPSPQLPVSWQYLPLIFGAGVGITFGFRVLMRLFSSVLQAQAMAGANAGLVMGSIFIALAVTAIPSGKLAVKLGNRRAMVMGLAGMVLVCITVVAIRQVGMAIALAVLFGATFSLVSNGTIPFALSMVPPHKAGLGTGLFFSGGAAASSLFGSLAGTFDQLPNGVRPGLGVLALLLAGICIACAPRSAHAATYSPEA